MKNKDHNTTLNKLNVSLLGEQKPETKQLTQDFNKNAKNKLNNRNNKLNK